MPPLESPTPTESSTPRPPILVVDDEPLVLAALKETLRQARYEAVTVASPVAALEELRQREFSVIISDQRMPGLSGLELLAEARKLHPDTTRILMTAVLSLDTVIEAINQGEIYRFILKPWLREEFLATVQNAVQRYELLGQNARLQASTQAMNAQLVELNRSLEQQVKLVAQQNAQLASMNAALDHNFAHSLELCVHMLETFYPSLGSQARRVTRVCQSMAVILELSAEERRVLECGARLHDIGLVRVPRSVIRRWQESEDCLDAAGWAQIEQHPVFGQDLAVFGSGLESVGDIIRAHHERMDGGGYPDQLAGDAIPWLARLLAVAVAYCGVPLPPADALEKVQRDAEGRFDPEAVRVLIRALPLAALERKEKEVALTELRPGMVLARGVYTSSGLLLAPEEQALNATSIERILSQSRVEPVTESLVIYC